MRPGEDSGEYVLRLQPWFRERVGEASDADDLWNFVVRKVDERGAKVASDGTGWMALAYRFARRQGGSIHFTNPAATLLAKYGFDLSVFIYKHFERGGSEGGVRSYWRVGESSREERIGIVYVPQQDAVVVWHWGEADYDPDLAVLDELDQDA